jgi:Mg2+/Co2+ transporter CorB
MAQLLIPSICALNRKLPRHWKKGGSQKASVVNNLISSSRRVIFFILFTQSKPVSLLLLRTHQAVSFTITEIGATAKEFQLGQLAQLRRH